MPDEDKSVDRPFSTQPFKAILGETTWDDMESRRVKCLGAFISAGGGGVIMMLKNWETLNHRAIPQPEKVAFLTDVVTAMEQLRALKVDVSRDDALWIALLSRASRVYWPGDESEVKI